MDLPYIEDLFDRIAELYGYSGIRAIKTGLRPGGRLFARIRTNEDKFIVKEWPSRVSYGGQAIDPINIIRIARNEGVPVSEFLPTLQGEESFLWRGRRLSLQRVLGDRTCDISKKTHVAKFAMALGSLHRATFRHAQAGESWSIVSMSEDYLDAVRQHLKSQAFRSPGLKTLSTTVERQSERLVHIQKLMSAEGWHELPLIPVHGDYHHHNVRFEGDDLVAIVDFDQARLEPRLYDIAYALGHLYGTYWPREGCGGSFWTTSRSMSDADLIFWLDHYLETGPSLNSRERRLLHLACAAVWPRIIEDTIPSDEEGLLQTSSVDAYMDKQLERIAQPGRGANALPRVAHDYR